MYTLYFFVSPDYNNRGSENHRKVVNKKKLFRAYLNIFWRNFFYAVDPPPLIREMSPKKSKFFLRQQKDQ